MSEDYSYLEGMEFTYFNGSTNTPAKVLYADYDIGLTCIEDDGTDDYIICIHGPSTPNPTECYEQIFSYIVYQIKTGHVDANKTYKLYEDLVNHSLSPKASIPASACAFNQ